MMKLKRFLTHIQNFLCVNLTKLIGLSFFIKIDYKFGFYSIALIRNSDIYEVMIPLTGIQQNVITWSTKTATY